MSPLGPEIAATRGDPWEVRLTESLVEAELPCMASFKASVGAYASHLCACPSAGRSATGGVQHQQVRKPCSTHRQGSSHVDCVDCPCDGAAAQDAGRDHQVLGS